MSITETVTYTTVVESVQFKDVPTEGESPAPLVETVLQFSNYGAAAIAACNWIQPRPWEHDLRFYVSRLGPARHHRVGLGVQGTSSVLDLVRLDNDDSGKGIHFNARRRAGDNSNKLAAVITPTVGMQPAARQALYMSMIWPLQDMGSPITLWNAWLSGRQPTNDDLREEKELIAKGALSIPENVEGGDDVD